MADESVSSSPLRQLLPTNRLVTVAEVATALAVSEQTVFRAVHDGRLKAFKIGRKIRFNPKDVTDYVARSAMGKDHSDLDDFITKNIGG